MCTCIALLFFLGSFFFLHTLIQNYIFIKFHENILPTCLFMLTPKLCISSTLNTDYLSTHRTHNWFWVDFQKLFLLHFYSDSSCIRNSRALWYLFLNPNRVRNVHWILPESMYYKFVTFPYCITLWYMISHLHKDERPDHILSYDSSFTYVLYSKRKGKTWENVPVINHTII